MGSCSFCTPVQEHTRKKATLCATRPPGNGCLCLARALSARTNMDIRRSPFPESREWSGRSDYQVVIAAVDGEGEKRRVIPWPEEERGSLVFIGQSKGLLHCTSGKKDDLGNMTELLISVLENYDTDRWILKGSVSCLQLFGEMDCSLADSTVAFHPDHNMVFFFHIWNRKLVSYDMDSKEVSTLCTLDGWWLPITPYCPYFVKSSALAKKE
ncbi:hypothetical protein PVAP13_2KG357712 [Panicum virgatum]|uniref:Uncharacterized protein n=1 Tax=Panicum virgatum TaxID=38727 RepID=A0A8T0VZA2_PANVG|nr:hypothetical protein PVAP13_2KG357712 [Panicum virgatum]